MLKPNWVVYNNETHEIVGYYRDHKKALLFVETNVKFSIASSDWYDEYIAN